MLPPVHARWSDVVDVEVWCFLAHVQQCLFCLSFDLAEEGCEYARRLRGAFAGNEHERERRVGVESAERFGGGERVLIRYIVVFSVE